MTVATYFEALEADFQAYYGLDLRAALWGDTALGSRRLFALIKGIGPDSALGRQVMAEEPKQTPTTDEQQLHAFFDVDVVRRL